MENEEETTAGILSLPYDTIIIFLDYTSITDIVHFGATCKKFNELVKSSHCLWKQKFRNSVNNAVFNMVEKQTDGNWLNEMKSFTCLQSDIYAGINDMAACFYRYKRDMYLYEVHQFLNNTYSSGFSYYCSVEILQDILRKARKNTITTFEHANVGNKPFTLTDKHYAKMAVQHLVHPYLAIKWVQAHMTNEFPPEFVLNFFTQWVDPSRMHTDVEVDNVLNSLASMVATELKKIHPGQLQPIEEQCAKGDITEAQILAAISQVMYKQKRLTAGSVANRETLDIVKVVELGCGHDVAIAAIFAALAKKFGVWCELIAFSNHLFLELRGSQNKASQIIHRIEINSGKVAPQGRCPYRNPTQRSDCKYCPNSLLQYVTTAFLRPMGSYKTWYMQNAIYLLDFLTSNMSCDNKYKYYLPYLIDNTHLPVLSAPIELTSLTEEQLQMIMLILYLTKPTQTQRTETVVKRRPSKVRFAVGMVMQHNIYNYMCVVRDWESSNEKLRYRYDDSFVRLRHGHDQPYYSVVAVDQSERLVPQEQMEEVPQPTRLYHLEYIIAKEFSYFNGFAYVPNVHKQAEYPDDLPVSEHYRIRAETLNAYKQH